MPELPEVETLIRGLNKVLLNRQIIVIQVLSGKTWQGQNPENIYHSRVILLWRSAKIIGINLSNNHTLLIHLKMTGQLIFVEQQKRVFGGHPSQEMLGQLPSKHTRVIFDFNDGSKLFFNDLRKFGYVKLLDTNKVADFAPIAEVGPDPLGNEFTPNYLWQEIKRRPKSKIKQLIMNQAVIAGLGNIYSDESLFFVGIRPDRLDKEINRSEAEKLQEAIVNVLKKGIQLGGTSWRNFVNEKGEKGRMQNSLQVYGRHGLPCLICHTPIERIKLGGRSSCFCPKCQQ